MTGDPGSLISVSVVSHGHGSLVGQLLADLARIASETRIEVILTNNLSDVTAPNALPGGLSGRIVHNATPLGFGHNHNNAFGIARGGYFCVLNPDLRLPSNPFPALLAAIAGRRAGLGAPAVLAPSGSVEDSARRFPTPRSLLRRRTGGDQGRHVYAVGDPAQEVDWVAGMFMLLPADAFAAVGGFDQRFFLYCEDVDLCARLWRAGRPVVLCPQATAVHDARRQSHFDWRFLRWHLASYLRLFAYHPRWPARPSLPFAA